MSIHTTRAAAAVAGLLIAGLAQADGSWLGTSYCTATVNSSGAAAAMGIFGPDHGGSGQVFMNDPVVLSATPVPVGVTGLFIFGQTRAQVPFGDGFLCLASPVHRLPATVSGPFGGGTLEQNLTFSREPTFTPGAWYFQAWFRDPAGGPAGFNLSDGVSLSISP